MLTLVNLAEIAAGCGLSTMGEAYDNIRLHHHAFLKEDLVYLVKEIEAWVLPPKTLIDEWAERHGLEWYYRTKQDRIYGCPSLRRKEATG